MTGMDTSHAPVTKHRPGGPSPSPDYFKDKSDSEIRGILIGLLRADGLSEARARQIMRTSKSQAHRDRQAGQLAWPGNENRTTAPRRRRASRVGSIRAGDAP